jgi:hypothetical protein
VHHVGFTVPMCELNWLSSGLAKWLWGFRFKKRGELPERSGACQLFKQFVLIHFLLSSLVVKTLAGLAHCHVKTATHLSAGVSVNLLASSRLQRNVFVSTEFLVAGHFQRLSSPVDRTLILMRAIYLGLVDPRNSYIQQLLTVTSEVH